MELKIMTEKSIISIKITSLQLWDTAKNVGDSYLKTIQEQIGYNIIFKDLTFRSRP